MILRHGVILMACNRFCHVRSKASSQTLPRNTTLRMHMKWVLEYTVACEAVAAGVKYSHRDRPSAR